MLLSTMCSWCHKMNSMDYRFCTNCGHEAHISRLQCQCPRCRPLPPQLFPCAGCSRPMPINELMTVFSEPDATGTQLGRFLCGECLQISKIILEIDQQGDEPS